MIDVSSRPMCAWLHRAVSWLPDRRSLPTFQPHIGRGVVAVAFSTAGEFTSRSQLRDSPGFTPVFPFGCGDGIQSLWSL